MVCTVVNVKNLKSVVKVCTVFLIKSTVMHNREAQLTLQYISRLANQGSQVESQWIVTNEATLPRTIPASNLSRLQRI